MTVKTAKQLYLLEKALRKPEEAEARKHVHSFEDALYEATWVTEADKLAVEMARTLAAQLDTLSAPGDLPYIQVATKVNATAVQLLAVLTSLGMTAQGRRALELPTSIGEPGAIEQIDELSAIREIDREATS